MLVQHLEHQIQSLHGCTLPALEGFPTQVVSIRIKHHMILVSTPLHHDLH